MFHTYSEHKSSPWTPGQSISITPCWQAAVHDQAPPPTIVSASTRSYIFLKHCFSFHHSCANFVVKNFILYPLTFKAEGGK